MGIMYRQQVYTCGDYKQVRYYTVAAAKRTNGRKPHTKPTKAAQLWINQRYRQDKLTRLLNANFSPNDYEVHLTYSQDSQPETADGVIRDVQNYIRRVRYACSRAGQPPPLYIWVPEGDGIRRFHVHMTIQACLPRDMLEALWGTVVGADDKDIGSITFSKLLRFDRNGVEGLARYVTKESREELEQMQFDPDTGEVIEMPANSSPFKKSYYCSRGLKNPQAEVSVVSQSAVVEMCTVDAGSREPLERRFPGWDMSDSHPYYDEQTGRWFLYASMYRRGSFMRFVRGDEIERRDRRHPPEPEPDEELPW